MSWRREWVSGGSGGGHIDAVPVHGFASITAKVELRYRYSVDAPRTRVSVVVDDNDDPSLTVPAGDTNVFWEEFLASREPEISQAVGQWLRRPVVPVVSLVGRNLENAKVPEVPEFDARVFRIGSGSGQILAVAIDASPGCEGIVEDVRKFIGDFEYGVLSDEYVVAAVMHHKWNRGGFHRTLPATQEIRINRNGAEQDATVLGSLHLNSLDVINAEMDSNSRSDYVRLGGAATLEPLGLRLSDGTELGTDQVDLGPIQDASWSTFTQPQIDPPAVPDLDLRQFQQRAHVDGYRHLARPFARCPADPWAASIGYTRLEGVSGHLLSCGFIGALFS
jgi:hypothetical protein